MGREEKDEGTTTSTTIQNSEQSRDYMVLDTVFGVSRIWQIIEIMKIIGTFDGFLNCGVNILELKLNRLSIIFKHTLIGWFNFLFSIRFHFNK